MRFVRGALLVFDSGSSLTVDPVYKARERELATLDEKSSSSGIAEPYARYKLKARTGEKGRCLWPRLVQKLESGSVRKK